MKKDTPDIVTQDTGLISILGSARQIAPYNTNVLITGESGTGKDLLAQYIHSCSTRSVHPLVKIDLSATPETLIESELFGHVRGAYSGAHQDRNGRLKAANESTVYLDHINELRHPVQARLTRVLQERQFEPLGSNIPTTVDIRIVASSRQDLGSLVQLGKFREDLYFRLSVMPINLPPLRKRSGDIPLLAKYFLEKYSEMYNKPKPTLDTGTLDILCTYHWPGNVRELQNQMERLVVTSNDDCTISPQKLNLDFDYVSDSSLDILAEQNLSLEQIEKLYIHKVLLKYRGNKSKTARILGINRKTLLEKRKKYNLE
jgi:transcriptional regulator with PAS, ATPase and Fis domain